MGITIDISDTEERVTHTIQLSSIGTCGDARITTALGMYVIIWTDNSDGFSTMYLNYLLSEAIL